MEFRRRAAVLGAVFAVLTGVLAVPAAAAAGIGELHGLVWFDRDGNFRHDPGDPGRAGAKVTAHLVSPPTDEPAKLPFAAPSIRMPRDAAAPVMVAKSRSAGSAVVCP